MISPDTADRIVALLEQVIVELRRSSGTDLPASRETSKCRDVDTEKSETIDSAEYAGILGVHPRTLRRWVHRGKVPRPSRIGNVLRWRRKTVDAWLQERSK